MSVLELIATSRGRRIVLLLLLLIAAIVQSTKKPPVRAASPELWVPADVPAWTVG